MRQARPIQLVMTTASDQGETDHDIVAKETGMRYFLYCFIVLHLFF